MRLLLALVCLAGSAAFAQSLPALEPAAANQDPQQVRKLVEAGALPRARLGQAEQATQDKQDRAILDRILYGSLTVEELTESQADEMVAAAQRRFDRRKAELEHAQALVEQGAAPMTSLLSYLLEYDQGRKTLDLALSRARLLRDIVEMARAELSPENTPQEAPQPEVQVAERYDGDGVFGNGLFRKIVLAFERQFRRPLPVSARGDTAIHRMMGFDHRGRVDVALNPDQTEGVWLREYLATLRIPYFAFRGSIPGKSTAPHIHIGAPSTRLRAAD